MLSPKQRSEQAAFLELIARLGEASCWGEIRSPAPPHPDLHCDHRTRGLIAVEVARLVDQSIAELQSAGTKARQTAFSTSDPTARIIKKKLSRKFETTASRIELLIYTTGQIITPDDSILATIGPLLDAGSHPFAEVWFMGERTVGSVWRES